MSTKDKHDITMTGIYTFKCYTFLLVESSKKNHLYRTITKFFSDGRVFLCFKILYLITLVWMQEERNQNIKEIDSFLCPHFKMLNQKDQCDS